MAFEGIRVIDCSVFVVGPLAASILGDFGAEVIKVEERSRGDPSRGMEQLHGVSLQLPGNRWLVYDLLNCNKKSMTVDLKKDKGREIVYRLVEKSDVFVTNMMSRSITNLGIDYSTLCRYNPQLIYARSSSFGLKGPNKDVGAFDNAGQAKGGLMLSSGEAWMPPVMVTDPMADYLTGISLALGAIVALFAREKLGVGQEVDTSFLSAIIGPQSVRLATYLWLGKNIPRMERAKALNPLNNWYECKDGRWVFFCMFQQSDRFWPNFCRALGITELEADPRFKNSQKRAENCEELVSICDNILITKRYDEWERIFRENGLLFAIVNDIPSLASDPDVIENQYIVDFNHPTMGNIKFPGPLFQLSKTPGSVRQAAPECGQHTEEVLLEILGYTWEEISQLKEMEVI